MCHYYNIVGAVAYQPKDGEGGTRRLAGPSKLGTSPRATCLCFDSGLSLVSPVGAGMFSPSPPYRGTGHAFDRRYDHGPARAA